MAAVTPFSLEGREVDPRDQKGGEGPPGREVVVVVDRARVQDKVVGSLISK